LITIVFTSIGALPVSVTRLLEMVMFVVLTPKVAEGIWL
jgi:hypothetical protein